MTTFSDAVVGYIQSDDGQKLMAEAVKKAVSEAIRSALSYGSPLTKQINEAVANSLQLNGTFDLPSHSDSVLKIMRAQVESLHAEAIQKTVVERMSKLLEVAPDTIKLSELVESYKSHLKDKYDSGCVCHDEQRITFGHRNSNVGFDYYWLSSSPKVEQSRADIEFCVYQSKLWTLRLAHTDAKQLFAGPFYNFERLLFQLKAQQSKIVTDINVNDVDLNYSSDE